MDLMIDIETLGLSNESSITSIAVVEFDIKTGDIYSSKQWSICPLSNEFYGRKIEANTVKWLLSQDEKVRNAVFKGEYSLDDALSELSYFFDNKNYNIWAKSPSFDCAIINNALDSWAMPRLWEYSQENDVRTLMNLFPEIVKEVKFEGTQHDSLDDCIYQISCVSAIYDKVINKKF